VSEQLWTGTADGRESWCLIFDSGDVVRRVRNYPATWLTLSSVALAELSWRR
jgi:hypothetical protein